MLNVKDITPKEIKIIPAKDKLEVVDPSQDIGAVVGGLGGRLASTIKKAINAEGNFVNDVINQQLDTHAKQILGNFTFGASGAITIQTDADNGLWISPTGILGKKAGENTFVIGIDGTATFAGTLSGASGTFGTITAGTITGVDVFAQRFRYLRWTVVLPFNTTDGWTTSADAGATLSFNANNTCYMLTPDGADRTVSIYSNGIGVQLGDVGTDAVRVDKYPSLEAIVRFNVLGAGGVDLGFGESPGATTNPRMGIQALVSGGSTVVRGTYYSDGAFATANFSDIDGQKWHKYRMEIVAGASNYDLKWYVDDVLVATVTNQTFTDIVGLYNFAAQAKNNWGAGAPDDRADIYIAHALFQEDY